MGIIFKNRETLREKHKHHKENMEKMSDEQKALYYEHLKQKNDETRKRELREKRIGKVIDFTEDIIDAKK